MARVLTAAEIDDLVATTLTNLGKDHFEDLASTLVDYIALPTVFKNQSKGTATGYGIDFNVLTEYDGNARNVGYYDEDSISIVNGMHKGTVAWRNVTSGWAYDQHELAINNGPEQIVSLAKEREVMCRIGVAEHMENTFFGAPTTTTDNTTPFGLPYWVVKNATEGFNGGDPTGITGGAGGLAAATYPAWQNYTGTYSAVTTEDLVRKLKKACHFTSWRTPVAVPSYSNQKHKRMFLTGYDVLQPLEELLETRNDNLGRDLAVYDGQLLFKRTPVMCAPWLDENDTDDPFYGVDTSTFGVKFLPGFRGKQTGPTPAANAHHVRHVFLDWTFNFICTNRRKNFVLYSA